MAIIGSFSPVSDFDDLESFEGDGGDNTDPPSNSFSPAHLGGGSSESTGPTSAALLPSSAFDPTTPLTVPGPQDGIIPTPSIDDVAQSPPFNMTAQQVATIRNQAENQALVSGVASLALGPVVEYGLGSVGVPSLIATLVGGGIDLHDDWNLAQRLRSAPDEAVYKQLNDSMNQASQAQSVPPTWRAFP